MTTTCKNCGESLWIHQVMDYSGVWQEGDTCEEFEKDMSEKNEIKGVIYLTPANKSAIF